MGYDDQKLQDVTLALLGACEFDGGRAWKRHDFGIMDALHARGLITDPRGRQESVCLADQGLELAKRLAVKYFGGQ